MFVFALLAPLASADGTVVGNPTHIRFAAGSGLTYTAGALQVTDQVVTFCNNATLTIAIDAQVNIGDELILPAGEICAIDLYLNAATTLSGTGSGGTFAMTLQIPVIEITVTPSHTVSSTGTSDAIAIELGAPNWVTSSMLNMTSGVHRSITSSHTLHDGLATAIRFNGSIAD